jgi:hypothetical protein
MSISEKRHLLILLLVLVVMVCMLDVSIENFFEHDDAEEHDIFMLESLMFFVELMGNEHIDDDDDDDDVAEEDDSENNE